MIALSLRLRERYGIYTSEPDPVCPSARFWSRECVSECNSSDKLVRATDKSSVKWLGSCERIWIARDPLLSFFRGKKCTRKENPLIQRSITTNELNWKHFSMKSPIAGWRSIHSQNGSNMALSEGMHSFEKHMSSLESERAWYRKVIGGLVVRRSETWEKSDLTLESL
jgi:hypothetical protein